MSIPRPPDLRILPPGPDADPGLAHFSGAWGNGAWGGIGPVALVVERIHADGAVDVVYAFGACPQFGFEAGWNRRRGTIADGRLRLDAPAGFTTEFTLGQDGVLAGRFVPPEGYQARVWLEHVPGCTAETIIATLALPQPASRDLDVEGVDQQFGRTDRAHIGLDDGPAATVRAFDQSAASSIACGMRGVERGVGGRHLVREVVRARFTAAMAGLVA